MNIIILTNILTPYRKYFYDEFYQECKKRNFNFKVLVMAKSEPERHWNYDDFKTDYTILLKSKTLNFGDVFIHVNKGLKEILKKLQPDVVICGGSYLYPAVWRTIKLSKKYGFKVFEWSESHLNEARNYSSFKLKIREIIRKKIIKNFEAFWVAGEFSREFVSVYANKNAKYIFVPNLIDNKRFDSITKISNREKQHIKINNNIDLKKRIFITPARLSPVKGLLEFLELYKNCNVDNCQYIIVGDGKLKEDLQDYIIKNKLDVKLLGYKQEKEILKLYSVSNGFILPSMSDPNPLTCIEACWCGLPLLVSNHVGNYPEVIQKNKNGFVFDYDNKNEATEIINNFLNKSDEWFINSKKISKKIAGDIYNAEKVIPRILNETINIIENGGESDD